MLDNQITIAVDTENTGTTTDFIMKRTDEFQNRSVYYRQGSHSLASRDLLSFYRTPVTRSGNDPGVAKSAFKVTRDIVVPGVDTSTSITKPMICEVSFSMPVGFTAAQAKELRQNILALLDDDALMSSHSEMLEV